MHRRDEALVDPLLQDLDVLVNRLRAIGQTEVVLKTEGVAQRASNGDRTVTKGGNFGQKD
jgi:hypothetical protein